MLLALFLLSMPLSAEAEWMTNDLDIYASLRNDLVTVNDFGETFVVDHAECQIIKLNPDGSIALRFGKKGQGPGEFTYPGNIQAFGNHVYVDDFMSSSVIAFDREGAYVNQWKVSRTQDRQRIEDGWIFGSWENNLRQSSNFGALNKADLEFKNEQVLHDFVGKEKEEKKGPDGIQLQMKDGYAEMPFNPAPDMPRLGVTGAGKYAALVKPGGKLDVDIYDAKTGKVIASVSQPGQGLPFNEEWAEKLIEKRNKATEDGPSQGFKVKFTPDFPEFFPFAKSFWAHADGRFYLHPWSKNPDQPGKIICFDEKGKMQDHDLTPEVAERLFHLNETHGWVGTFDAEEEQAGVAKVPRKDLAAFIKANPINTEAQGGSVMVIGG